MNNQHSRQCCTMEKKRLLDTLRKCDFCATSYEEFRQCYRDAATESGQHSRACIVE